MRELPPSVAITAPGESQTLTFVSDYSPTSQPHQLWTTITTAQNQVQMLYCLILYHTPFHNYHCSHPLLIPNILPPLKRLHFCTVRIFMELVHELFVGHQFYTVFCPVWIAMSRFI